MTLFPHQHGKFAHRTLKFWIIQNTHWPITSMTSKPKLPHINVSLRAVSRLVSEYSASHFARNSILNFQQSEISLENKIQQNGRPNQRSLGRLWVPNISLGLLNSWTTTLFTRIYSVKLKYILFKVNDLRKLHAPNKQCLVVLQCKHSNCELIAQHSDCALALYILSSGCKNKVSEWT